MAAATYDRLGIGYVRGRQPEPRWQAAIDRALGNGRSVVNVGAGTGSYEPSGRQVLAVEPSTVMIAQRPAGAAPAIRATAEQLPFAGRQFDVAMAVSTLHHWTDWAAGIDELTRVARRVVVVHFEPAVHDDFWLVRDYLPELSDVWRTTPTVQDVAAVMGQGTQIEPLPVPWDCRDGFLSAYWRRPERYLDAEARRCMSGLQALDPGPVVRAMATLADDLETGRWHASNREVLSQEKFDGGWRLLVTP
ncbi:MAG TPA: class I SAM-dependent methyltransferase [Frankiaceae bacterium]|jgi:SAM-dependent methyltransferase|nr:class I SAM-dependent methyltransferase [Frankiaceae bacterium]